MMRFFINFGAMEVTAVIIALFMYVLGCRIYQLFKEAMKPTPYDKIDKNSPAALIDLYTEQVR